MTTTIDDTPPDPPDSPDPAEAAVAPARTTQEGEDRTAQLDGELRTANTRLSDTRHILGRTQLDLDATAGRLREAERRGRELGEEFDTFKTRVRDTAIRLAQRHGWCRTVDDALVEMGLEPRERDWRVTLTVEGRITVTAAATSEQAAINAALSEAGIAEGEMIRVGDHDLEIDDITAEAADDDD
jgi:hypothetical protein